MALSYAQRGPMEALTQRIRAYFAPVARATSTPSIFDAAKNGAFPLNSPPAPWLDAGWISDFKRASATKIQPLRSGAKGALQSQFRSALDATIEFDMHDWGKLQMAVSSGSQHINLLAEDPSASSMPSGGTPALPIATLPGSTAGEIVVGVGVVNSFNIGDLIAVDLDYTGQTGYVGSGIPGAYIKSPADVSTDAIANKQIVDAPKFQSGLSQIIDGVVACLNASAWAKQQ